MAESWADRFAMFFLDAYGYEEVVEVDTYTPEQGDQLEKAFQRLGCSVEREEFRTILRVTCPRSDATFM